MNVKKPRDTVQAKQRRIALVVINYLKKKHKLYE